MAHVRFEKDVDSSPLESKVWEDAGRQDNPVSYPMNPSHNIRPTLAGGLQARLQQTVVSISEFYKQLTWSQILLICTAVGLLIGILVLNSHVKANQQQIGAITGQLTHLNRTVTAAALDKDVEKNVFLESLYQSGQRSLRGHFKTSLNYMIEKAPELWRGMPADSVIEVLSYDWLQTLSEREVYEALMKWVDWDQIVRSQLLWKLFNETVRWEYMNETYLTATVRLDPLVQNDTEALAAIDFWRTKSGVRKRRDGLEVLVLIGGSTGGEYTSGVRIFDFDDHVWRQFSALNTVRKNHRAVILDGKMYVTGGYSRNETSSVERFDPSTDRWEPVQSMTSPRHHHCAVVLDGKIYVAGHTATAERYDPKFNQWTPIASMTTARMGHACAVYKGKIYAFGGHSNEARQTSEVYDLVSNQWIPILASKLGRRYFSLVTIPPQLPDEQPTLYAFGGDLDDDGDGGRLKSMDKLVGNPSQVGWQRLPESADMHDARIRFAATYSVTQRKIYAAGGWAVDGRSSGIEVFDLEAESWTTLNTSLPDARTEMALISAFLPRSVIKPSFPFPT